MSFYVLPSTITGNAKHEELRVAYSYYHVANTVSLKELFQEALIRASKERCDVYNALDMMDNARVFEDLKFGMGDGYLQYYLFNWHLPQLPPSRIGLVML
mmetsp:Transcript_8048/g.10733  ORF Transcript_8048/g.10733 Transcript_8048/m.10733 type:complete len:100 (-) Transcript_8048:21-320(-)